MKTTALPERTMTYLSKIGIKPRMTVSEVCKLYTELRTRLGEKQFNRIDNQVYLNLNSMQPGRSFAYLDFFQKEKSGAFIIIAHLYITENPDYEFSNDYKRIKRINNQQKQKTYGKKRTKKAY